MVTDSLLKQAQKMREKQQRELSETVTDGSSIAGDVDARMDGHKRLLSIKIDPSAIDPRDLKPLEQQLLEAVNEATDSMDAILERRHGPSSGIPDLF